MRCPRCEEDNRPTSSFCVTCGARLGVDCTQCGASLTPQNKFCPDCGHPVLRPRFAAPEDYTPRRLADKILAASRTLEGERRQVTVLFADLKGSMELVAPRDPEEALGILDPMLELMMEAVHRYEGVVNQVMGDGIMALFGAPLAQEDHAIRACYAALSMRDSLRHHSDRLRQMLGGPVEFRIGLNSGEVVVRTIGDDLRMDYTAVGLTTHLAARLEQLAPSGAVLVSPDTRALIEGFVTVKPLGPTSVKGLSVPVDVFEVTGAGPLRTRFERSTARGLTTFVGREDELGQLDDVAEHALAGHGRLVGVVGDAGVGKSRLIWEFARGKRETWLVLETRAVPYGRTAAYLPVLDLLKAFFGVETRDDTAGIQDKVRRALASLDPALDADLPALLALLDAPDANMEWQRLDPTERRRATFDAVRRLLLRQSQARPLLLVCEDLHWIDAETEALFDALVESLPAARILFLINYRYGYQHAWAARSFYRELRLDPLVGQGAHRLMDALIGTDVGLQDLRSLLLERTEGNPFFLEESVLMLADAGVLLGERGQYRLGKAAPTTWLPGTVRDVLAARIDRLDHDDKRLLEAASVIGKDMPLKLLDAVVDLPDERLHQSLARLQAAEFLYERRLFPDLEYTFRHPLTLEVAYAGLVRERRRTLHARVMETMELLWSDRLDEHVGMLAHHAFHGEQWERAVSYLRQSGAKAALRSASADAVARFEQALVALTHLPQTPANRVRAIDLRFDLRNPLFVLAEFSRALDVLQEIVRLAESIDQPMHVGRACSFMANAYFMLGEIDRGVELADRALGIAVDTGNLTLQAITSCHLGQLAFAKGDYRGALAMLAKTEDLLSAEPPRGRQNLLRIYHVVAECFRALAFAKVGAFADAIDAGERCRQVAERSDTPFFRALASWALGSAHLTKGVILQARTLLQSAWTDCDRADLRAIRPWIATELGLAHLLASDGQAAMPVLRQAVEEGESRHLMAAQSLRLVNLAEAYLQGDLRVEAAAFAARGLEHALRHRESGAQAAAQRLLGEVGARGGPDAQTGAIAHFEGAISLGESLGMRPLVAQCHLGLGALHRRMGDRPRARACLTGASTAFGDMAMPHWMEAAEAELEVLGSPPARL